MSDDTIAARLESLGIQLPGAPAPAGSYVPAVQNGNLLYLAGSLPMRDGQIVWSGAVGETRSLEEAQEAAELCALNQLAVAKDFLGSLERIQRVVTLTGFVWGISGYPDSPKVINGASDILVKILGDAGKHARAAVTVAGLPLRATVEVQSVFAISEA